MPKKYHIHVEPTPPRFSPVPKFSALETGKCLGCVRCVKSTSCIYNVYRKKEFDPVQIVDTGDVMCVGCMRCVQECKNNIFSRILNPRYDRMGNDYWTAGIISRIWKQADSGKIPVSGAGYRGPFCGPGFDQIWTDMSEIVRPTRDGIHGREYISTVIDLGRKPERLVFDDKGGMVTEPPPLLQVSLPLVLDIPPFGFLGEGTRRAIALAAERLETVAVATCEEARGPLEPWRDRLIVRFDPAADDLSALDGIRIVELNGSGDTLEQMKTVRAAHPEIIVSARVGLDENAADRAAELAAGGTDILHLQAGLNGNGLGKETERFITDILHDIHMRLVEESLREQVTILASGGIGMAEHMAKLLICGADGAGADLAPMIAMECRACSDCAEQTRCPVDLDKVEETWGAQRIANLLGSWHSQLIEVMGAMGIREARRLRGEVGRAMFFQDLEKECFAPIFGKRIEEGEAQKAPAVKKGKSANEPEQPSPSQGSPMPEPRGYPPAEHLVSFCKSRFRNKIGKYRVVATLKCTHCGKCAEACTYGVLQYANGKLLSPKSHRCHGAAVCRDKGSFCMDACPEEAIRLGLNPSWGTIGDPRWTADLLTSTWAQAETGSLPRDLGLETRIGASGGGFDKIDFIFPRKPPNPSLKHEEIDLKIPLNQTGDGRPEVEIGFPVYGGGMSFGSIGLATMIARARAYKAFDSFTCTGEGGYPDGLTHYDDNVITQVATGLFGVREETIQRVRIVEFKYAQGAKPGLGGHLLGDKVTAAVAKGREAVEGSALFSPFPFHSVYSVEDHKKHVDWIKVINPKALVSVKVSTPSDVEMVAVGSYYAGAHIIHLDGSYGGTGAAPDIAKKNIAMPLEYAIPKVHRFLEEEGVRDKMTLIASGGIRSAWDVAKAIALGADGVVIGTPEMVALECIRCGHCESGRGCPRGIATTDPELSKMYDADWGTQRLVNLFHSWCVQLHQILWRFGMKSVRELVGRSDLLSHREYERQEEAEEPQRKSA